MKDERLNPVHPGEILLEEFIKPMNLKQKQLAFALGIPERRVNEILVGKCAITADIALRIGRYFKMSPQFWLGLQMDYDLDMAKDQLSDQTDREVMVYAA